MLKFSLTRSHYNPSSGLLLFFNGRNNGNIFLNIIYLKKTTKHALAVKSFAKIHSEGYYFTANIILYADMSPSLLLSY